MSMPPLCHSFCRYLPYNPEHCACVQDAYLPQRLVDKLMFMYNYIEMARVTGVPMSFLLSRGQSIKVFSQILRKSRSRNLVVPNIKARPAMARCLRMGVEGVGAVGAGVAHLAVWVFEWRGPCAHGCAQEHLDSESGLSTACQLPAWRAAIA